MQLTRLASLLAILGGAVAQRPSTVSICDYYTTALLKNNTGENQNLVLTLLVNTVVIGNYTMPNVGITVPGILAPGKFNNTDVNLAQFFTGALNSTNEGGATGVSVNFLDGGGAAPLLKNMPANDQTSNQYFLLTHLYSFFGALLQCSQYNTPSFAAYTGVASMYEVHKFMALGPAEVGYFITQVGLAAASFGVANDDVAAVGAALSSLFGERCAPAVQVIPPQSPALQAICIESDCPLAKDAQCGLYSTVVEPVSVTTTTATTATTATAATAATTAMTTGAGGGSASTTAGSTSATGTVAPTTVSKGGAAATGLSLIAVAGGIAAFMI